MTLWLPDERHFGSVPQDFVLNRDSPQARGLVGYWPLNETGGGISRDLSGNGDDGVWSGNIIPAISSVGRCVEFDAASHIILPSTIERFTTEATLAVWCKLRNATPSTASKTGWIKLTECSAINLSCHYPYTDGNGYINTFASSRHTVTLSAAVNRTEWHFVCITNTPGANGWKMYQNNILVHSATGEADIALLASEGYLIGKSNTNAAANYFFDGWMSEVRLYNRALSASEVWNHYNPPTRWELKQPRNRIRYFYVDQAVPPAGGGVSQVIGGGIVA